MTTWTRKSAVFYLTGIFLAGVMAGAFGGYSYARKRVFSSARQEDMPKRLIDWMQRELDLNPDQVKQIEPVIEETGRQIGAEHTQSMDRVQAIVKASDQRIISFLRPDQLGKMDDLVKKRKEFFSRVRGPRGSRHSRPDGRGSNGPPEFMPMPPPPGGAPPSKPDSVPHGDGVQIPK